MGKNNRVRKNPGNQSKNLILGGMGVVLVILFIAIVVGVSSNSTPAPSTTGTTTASPTSSSTAELKNGVQEVALNISAAGYNPSKLVVKKGVPVKILTNSTKDAECIRGIMIPDFNINEPLDIGNDTLEFTPDKTGTFEFMCQMRMSKGILEVVA